MQLKNPRDTYLMREKVWENLMKRDYKGSKTLCWLKSPKSTVFKCMFDLYANDALGWIPLTIGIKTTWIPNKWCNECGRLRSKMVDWKWGMQLKKQIDLF